MYEKKEHDLYHEASKLKGMNIYIFLLSLRLYHHSYSKNLELLFAQDDKHQWNE